MSTQAIALILIALLGILFAVMGWTAYEIGLTEGYDNGLEDAIRIINEEYKDIYCQGCNPERHFHLEPVKAEVKKKSRKQEKDHTAEFYKKFSNKVIEKG